MASGTASAVAAPTAEPRRERGLTVAGASKHWGPVQALHDVSLRVDIGEVVGLVGENGAGKSTLVGVVSGTVRPDGGEVTINGTPGALGDARQLAALGVSVVMQEQSLVENLRVYENLFLGAEDLARARARERCSRRRVGRRQLRELADELLQGVGLTTIPADARVGALTFPERQLVEIAKAFVTAELRRQSAVILLDEPTSALSRRETEVLFTLIERWRDRAAFVYVSHVLSDVRRTCTRIVVLKDGVVVDDLANEGIDDSRLHELMVGRVRNADYYREADQQVVDPDLAPAAELIGASVDGAFADVDLAIRPVRSSASPAWSGRAHRTSPRRSPEPAVSTLVSSGCSVGRYGGGRCIGRSWTACCTCRPNVRPTRSSPRRRPATTCRSACSTTSAGRWCA